MNITQITYCITVFILFPLDVSLPVTAWYCYQRAYNKFITATNSHLIK